ncbi:ribosomal-processing cysteine protease Prp [Bacillus taeanensis]|uniref:Ribosomal processing cysteine protease Prp n=1 Tax=Bacillus taeanensis TaxID=273032 RepID=A0A366Y5B2_9BACI|nr:ribosomal-processing cysteine protease Prp [Bacillus taeanensis]RBW71603.1 ribosomal-processing cysteine protease Prp [Bacillus taeanensis]
MITVNVNRNKQKQILSFTMSGHAEAGPYGYDIVCAGASAVSFGTVNAIHSLCDVELIIDMEEDGGFLRCDVPKGLPTDIDEKVQLLLEAMVVSLKSIASEYGKHIRIS